MAGSESDMEYDAMIYNFDHLRKLLADGVTDWRPYGEVYTREMGDLVLFNYAPSAQYMGRWNWFERVSRGLIINRKTGEIVARPFSKFFNYGQEMPMPNTFLVEVTEKLDGSLGILYRHEGKLRIATRGSFDGEQAEWATVRLQKYDNLHLIPDELTLLFEIIYPDNRVVIDYGSREELYLIGARNRVHGQLYYAAELDAMATYHGFPRPKTYTFEKIEDILEAATKLTHHEEGWVLRYSDNRLFKVKGEAYLQAHRLVTQVSYRAVLRAISENMLDAIIQGIPDEFLGDVKTYQSQIQDVVWATKVAVQSAFEQAPRSSRKEFAQYVTAHHKKIAHYLFAMLDGKNIEPMIYQKMRETDETNG